jgi:hypothetical protein
MYITSYRVLKPLLEKIRVNLASNYKEKGSSVQTRLLIIKRSTL